MLLDPSTPHFSQDVTPRLVYGYAGIRPHDIKNNVQSRVVDKTYALRMSSGMLKKVEALVIAGELTNNSIAKQLGISRGQVNYASRRLFLRGPGRKPKIMNTWGGLIAVYSKPRPTGSSPGHGSQPSASHLGIQCGACRRIFQVWPCDVQRRKYCSKPCQVIGFSRRKVGLRVTK